MGQVLDLNLRTYASAREFIFGSNQLLLQNVHRAAKANRAVVADYVPVPPRVHVIEQAEGNAAAPRITTTQGPSAIEIRRGGAKQRKGPSSDPAVSDVKRRSGPHGD